MIFLCNKMLFSWLVMASSLNVLLSASAHLFKLSTGLGNSICIQNLDHASTKQMQPPLKSSSMEPNAGSEESASCGWGVLKTEEGTFVKSCSSVKESSGISPQVVNGDPTEPGEFPSLVTFYFLYSPYTGGSSTGGWGMKCIGILLTPEWMLTRRYCWLNVRLEKNLTLARIYAGKYNHTPGTDPEWEQGPSEPVEFVDYPEDEEQFPDPNKYPRKKFTLTKFSPPFTLNERVQLAHWPAAEEGIPKDPVTLVGWGSTNESYELNGPIPFEFVPNKKTLNLMDRQKCSDAIEDKVSGNKLYPEQFCLEEGESKSGPRPGDGPSFSIDTDGKQTFNGFKEFWLFVYGKPPVMTAASFIREFAEATVGTLA